MKRFHAGWFPLDALTVYTVLAPLRRFAVQGHDKLVQKSCCIAHNYRFYLSETIMLWVYYVFFKSNKKREAV
jgi:hypothetical protein